ncbi:hypothetical protein MMC26_001693 [Xylographa opegraphella]|nr:hypothetical protein [Xylographa opegraphella]
MATMNVEQIIGQPFPIPVPQEESPTPSPPFVIYDDSTALLEQNAAGHDNRVILLRMHDPAGPYIASDGTIEACPSPEEATQWFADDEASLRIVDHDLRATISYILLSPERQPSRARFLACAIVKHFGYWLWLMKDKTHPYESYTIQWISLVLKWYLLKSIRPSGLTAFEKSNCVRVEAFMTKQVFRHFPELCDLVLEKNWVTLDMLVDPRTDEPPIVIMESDYLYGGYIEMWIATMEYRLQRAWISLEFLCDDEPLTVPYPLIMAWEAQKQRLKDASRHCERLLQKLEKREARVLQEASGNANPDPRRVPRGEGKENQPPVVERRIEDREGGFLDWQERTLRRLRR